MYTSALLLLPLLPAAVVGKNDWSVPCLSGMSTLFASVLPASQLIFCALGWCEYDSGDGVNAAFGAMTLVCDIL